MSKFYGVRKTKWSVSLIQREILQKNGNTCIRIDAYMSTLTEKGLYETEEAAGFVQRTIEPGYDSKRPSRGYLRLLRIFMYMPDEAYKTREDKSRVFHEYDRMCSPFPSVDIPSE